MKKIESKQIHEACQGSISKADPMRDHNAKSHFEFMLVFAVFFINGLIFMKFSLSEPPWRKWSESYASTSELRIAIARCLEVSGSNNEQCNSFEKLNLLNLDVDERKIQNVNVVFIPGSVNFLMTGNDGKDTCEVAVTRSIVDGSPTWKTHILGGHINQWISQVPCDEAHTGYSPLPTRHATRQSPSQGMWEWACPNANPSDCRVVKAVSHATDRLN